MSPGAAEFEVLRFDAAPAAAGVAVVELEGAFAGPAPSRPRLLVERRGRGVELPSLDVRRSPWSATFAVPLSTLDDEDVLFSLVPGRGPLIALPSPTVGAEEDRYVRLARQANELRHRLGEASTAAEVAGRRLADAASWASRRAARDRLRDELRAARREAEEAAGRLRDELRAARREAQEAAGRLRDELRAARQQVEEASARAEAAEKTAEATRLQRDSAMASVEEAREALRRVQRELEGAVERADAAEADLAERGRELGELRAQAEAGANAEARVRRLEDRAIVAEDEARAARRELHDARARLEALERERREAPALDAGGTRALPAAHPPRGRDDAGPAPPEDDTLPIGTGDDDDTLPIRTGDDDTEPVRTGDETAQLPLDGDETAPIGNRDDADRLPDEDDETAPVRGRDDRARLGDRDDTAPAPADDDTAPMPVTARRADVATTSKRTVRFVDLADDDAVAGTEDAERTRNGAAEDHAAEGVRVLRPRGEEARRPQPPRPVIHDGDILEPAAVGARYIEPSETRPSRVTPARVVAAAVLVVLVLAIVAIVLGFSLV